MQPHSRQASAERVLQALKDACLPGKQYMPLDCYIETVLYHPEVGYYKQQKDRIGRSADTDFYTAASMGKVFSRLIVASASVLLQDNLDKYVFVEAGPETEKGIIGELKSHPFAATRCVRPGEAFDIPGNAVVFSNEIFDAQPFRRLVFRDGNWREKGVKIQDSSLEWIDLDLQEPIEQLPASAPEGYMIDWPHKAFKLMESVSQKQWKGLLIAFDYGLDSHTIFSERPAGTGRTYSGHRMGSNLLERPGKIDITCHVIWDILEKILRTQNFSDVNVYRQEAFFMQFAQPEIERIMTSHRSGFSAEKQSLMQLIHPGTMGHKFQVLCARRFGY